MEPLPNPASTPSPPISSLTSPIPVPTYGPGGTFSIFTSTHIASRPETGLRALLDHGSYHLWNSFTPHISINSQAPPQPTADGDGINDPQAVPRSLPPVELGAGDLQPGMRFTLTACLTRAPWPFALKNHVPLEITRVEALSAADGRAGYRVAWKSIGQPEWILRAERVQELVLVEGGDGGTEYRCWETFGGPVAWLVKLLMGGSLRKRFAECALDLKVWCERGEGEREVAGAGSK